MQIITIDDKKFLVIRQIYLDHFKSPERRDAFMEGRLRVMNKNNPNEVLLVREIFDAKFEDIVEPVGSNARVDDEVDSSVEEIQKPNNPFTHRIDIKI